MTERHTTIATASQVLWHALRSYGIEPGELFEAHGLDVGKWRASGERFDDAGLDALWEQALVLTGDSCLGLEVGAHWHPSYYHALGFAWLASESLHDGLSRTVRYFRMLASGVSLGLTLSGSECRLSLDQLQIRPKTRDASVDSLFSVLIRMCRLNAGDDFAPTALNLIRPKPDCSARFYELFRCPIRFGADLDAIWFDREQVERQLPSANRELACANQRIIEAYLAQQDKQDLASQLQHQMMRQLPSGEITEQHMADKLNLSVRTLQRRLADQGTSFKQLVDQTRRRLALSYVEDLGLPLKEIAFLLGFAEPASFTRAFKRWTGTAPQLYRDRLEAI